MSNTSGLKIPLHFGLLPSSLDVYYRIDIKKENMNIKFALKYMHTG